MGVLHDFYPHFQVSTGLAPKVFGYKIFVHVHRPNKGKLDPYAIKCICLGYLSTQKRYECYNPLSKLFYISTYVTFLEHVLFYSQSSLEGEIFMLKESSSFELLQPLDLPLALTQGVSPMPIESDSSLVLESVFSPPPITLDHFWFSQVFTRKKPAPKLTQVQEANFGLENENIGSPDSSLQSQSNNTSTNPTNAINNLDFPIAVNKGTKVEVLIMR